MNSFDNIGAFLKQKNLALPLFIDHSESAPLNVVTHMLMHQDKITIVIINWRILGTNVCQTKIGEAKSWQIG